MAITRELIHLMKGEIKIKSKKNVGTEISIFLDMNKSIEKSESKNIEVKEHISIEGTRVLLVEDNELNQLVAENSLTHFGCEVTKADNGKIAVDILSKEQFDIILMDIQMPELDGIEATKILRQEFRLGTPIIALTANAFKTEIDNCIAAGMNSYITKPFDEDELLKIIYKNIKMQSNLEINNSEEEKILYDLRNIQALSRGNDDFIQKMLSIFITQTQETIPMVEKAFEEKNYAEIARLIHRIKPSIEGVGIYSIKETVKDLEVKSKEQQTDFPELYTMFLEVKETLFTAINQLEREIK